MSPLLAAYAQTLAKRAAQYRKQARQLMDTDPAKAYELLGRAKAAAKCAQVICNIQPEARAQP